MPIHHVTLTVKRPVFLGGTTWRLERLNSINVVFGRNGSGKSVMLRMLRDEDPKAHHYIVPERSGEISFDSGLIAEVVDAAMRRNGSQGNFSPNYRQQIV